MLALSQSYKYNIENDDKKLGTLILSKFVKDVDRYKQPFEDAPKMEIVKIGNGDYDNIDNFIIESLNDYYNKLNTPSDLETKEEMLEQYRKLYLIWTGICEKKVKGNIVQLNELYGKISYGLYLLGYDDNQL